ncbi:hypothetical protein WQ57_04600 [Mesobacillus campisalis]|uniref:Uncharacterized protein n=1 Tax=Mesobacillus campisalis TaxID=1408103 RepID=A0A0M2SWX9_9BACI|nr:hypothetical protein [Mesobacillus campisalis]KKK39069.1 hypothetical protein WQ57_04600 [Mesobacillus campisalis]
MKNLPVNVLLFIFSISLNALGNSFMIIADLGSAPWTAAGQNLETVLPFSVGVCIILLNLFSFILSRLMKVQFTLGLVIKSLALAFAFGLSIDLFMYLHHKIYVPENIWVRGLYLLIGINLVALALCIYFQASDVYLPPDYLLKAFGERMNNYSIGNIVFMSIPISISLVIMLFHRHVTGLGIGTVLCMFGMGLLLDFYNRRIVIQQAPKPKTYSA